MPKTTTPHQAVWRRLRSGQDTSYLLALQGGGTFGAFQAGALIRLLEDSKFPLPKAISGTSAGALNAVVLANALAQGGTEQEKRDRAIVDLTNLWEVQIPEMTLEYMRKYLSDMWVDVTKMVLPTRNMLDLMHEMLEMWAQYFLLMGMRLPKFSASDNPLMLLTRQIDFDRLRTTEEVKLYIAVTEAQEPHNGRIFTNADLSPEIVAASGCLPDVFEPITVDGVAYIEGGFNHNPPLQAPINDGFDRVVLIRLNADDFNPPGNALEETCYEQARMFNQPLKRDLDLIAHMNAGTPCVYLFDIGIHGHHGFTPPQKRKVSHHLIGKLKTAGYKAANRALRHMPDTF